MTDERPVPPYSDEELKAYLCGEADRELRDRIDRQLDEDDELQARIASLDDLPATLSAAAAGLLDLAPVQRMSRRLSGAEGPDPDRTRRSGAEPAGTARRGMWLGLRRPAAVGLLAGCLLVALTLGGLIGRELFPRTVEVVPTGPPRWITAAVDHTNLYTQRTLTARAVDSETKAAMVELAGRHLSRDLTAIASDLPRFRFERAELLRFEDKPLAQLLYLHDSGTPFAFYILDTGEYAEAAIVEPRKGQIEELAATRWRGARYEYFTVGRLTRAQMDEVAGVLDARLR